MKKTIFNVLLFTTGAAIGSLVTWRVLKTKYERYAQEEIDSVKETWSRLSRQESNDEHPCDEAYEEDDEDEDDDCSSDVDYYNDLVDRYKSAGDEAENDGEGAGDEVPYINGPYVISPEDFGDGNYKHSLYCLTYYSDGVLANDWHERFDVDETIGEDSVEHFGDYVDDVLHVRNERLDADYEIVRDPRKYTDVIADNPLANAYAN